jgi:uncharacterized protein YdaU (DUF1376 family)
MRWLGVLLIALATVLPVLAEDWTTADGKTYKNVVVISQEDDGVRVTYAGGVGKIPYYELSADLQKRFGQDADSLAAKRAAEEKAQEEATLNAAAAEQKKQQDQTPAAQTKTQPVASPQPVAQPSAHTQPVEPPVNPAAAAPIHVQEKGPYPGAKFSYIESSDVCYLDSPPVDVWPVLAEDAPTTPNSPDHGTLTLRITTDGHKPEAPDKIEATFFSADAIKQSVGNHDVKFLVDGAYVPITNLENANGNDSSGAVQVSQSLSFYLSPEQARSIVEGKNINFSVGSNNYRIDDAGISILRKYFHVVDQLPPASPNLIRACHRFIAGLPSIVTIISTVCEYIILGSFAILAAAAIAVFILGVARFIKM